MSTELKILVTGTAEFLAGYFVQELLDHNHEVYGIDNYSRYGRVKKNYDGHPKYHFAEGDVNDLSLMKELCSDCEQVVALAVHVGGIAHFHHDAYDLLAENERVTASTFETALFALKNRWLKRIIVISSSMIFENTSVYPTPEGEQFRCASPSTTYGFQNITSEHFARAEYEQVGLPFTIIRPVNIVGVGERGGKAVGKASSSTVRLASSHVVTDLAGKVLQGEYPLHIFGSGRHLSALGVPS